MSDPYIITERLLQTGLVSCASFHTFITIFTGKWIAFEPLSILIKLPLLWGVRTVKCLIQTVNYNTTHYFSLFNYLHFHWLEQPSSHPGCQSTTTNKGDQGVARGQHTLPAHAEAGKPSESFPPAGNSISWEVEWEVSDHVRMKDGDAELFSTSFANTGN